MISYVVFIYNELNFFSTNIYLYNQAINFHAEFCVA